MARAHTAIHSDQWGDSSRARMLAAPPTRHTSRTERSRASADERSMDAKTGSSAVKVSWNSPSPSWPAMVTRTSAW